MNLTSAKQAMLDLIKKRGITGKAVLKALKEIPRENFVPKDLMKFSYDDNPLSIGEGQTISQPYTVAFMLEALELKVGDKVLEIGAGSGYNAALISRIVGGKGSVITIECIKQLADKVTERLKNYENIKVIAGDGSQGYELEAPYDKIIVTAASPKINKNWIDQLKTHGIIVAPVGHGIQDMTKIKKIHGHVKKEKLGSFTFVPLVGKDGLA